MVAVLRAVFQLFGKDWVTACPAWTSLRIAIGRNLGLNFETAEERSSFLVLFQSLGFFRLRALLSQRQSVSPCSRVSAVTVSLDT